MSLRGARSPEAIHEKKTALTQCESGLFDVLHKAYAAKMELISSTELTENVTTIIIPSTFHLREYFS